MIARVLGDAFADYAWTGWTVDAENHAGRLLALHTTLLGALAIPYGQVDVAVTAGGAIIAAAVWMRSDAAVPPDVWTQVAERVDVLSGDRASAAHAAESTLAPYRPVAPHVALSTVGVLPEAQGAGLGTATLAPGLARADRETLPAHLETSSAANVRFYRRLGFDVSAAVDLPGGGPRTWLMHRDPR